MSVRRPSLVGNGSASLSTPVQEKLAASPAVILTRRRMVQVRSHYRSGAFAVLATFLVLLFWSRRSSLHGRPRLQGGLICNPYDQPGYFHWHPNEPHRGQWLPHNQNECPPATDWIQMLRLVAEDFGERPPPPSNSPNDDRYSEKRAEWRAQDMAYESLWWLKNRTILIAGDSVDRNALGHLAFFADSDVDARDWHNISHTGHLEGWDIRGLPHIVDIDRLDTQVANVFFYGTDDADQFKHQVDWHAPGKLEDRLEELILPFTRQLKYPPSFIQLHSGMWDLALFGRQDAIRGSSTDEALDPERMEKWLIRMRSIIAAFQKAFPGVPIWLRTIHRVGPPKWVGAISEDYTHGIGQYDRKKHNFFTDLRCAQLQEMQRSIARDTCLPVNDFARWWEGYQDHQDKVHPDPVPGGLVYLNPLLNAIWMETIGRSHWQRRPCETG